MFVRSGQDPTWLVQNYAYMVSRRLDWRQLGILAERYLELVLADSGNTILLLLQAPIIAGCIVVVWGDNDQVTSSLYFVLTLSAIWFGTINASREIVKEKAIFEREARVGLDPTAYVLSKVSVLALLGFIQCLCLVFVVDRWVALPGTTFLHFLVLFAASMAGAGLGLAISAVVSTPDRATAAVPILLLPQILFSEMVMDHSHSSALVKALEDLTITAWTYQGLTEVAASEPDLFKMLQGMFTPLLMAGLLIGAAIFLVKRSVRR